MTFGDGSGHDNDMQVYYRNTVTGETSWELPGALRASVTEVVGEGAEPRSLLSAEPRPLLSAGGAYVGEWGLPPLPVPVVEDMPLCTTCLKEPRCMVTLPCAHLCVCMGCSART